jgi:alanyl-tRNA synthetase
MSRVLSGKEIRDAFVRFFVDRGHELVPSAPLIPRGDPTLLFTSAGMVPFKPHYVSENPPMRRAVSIQRCLRLSDLEEVGRTPYHATFFEMLGNFSFGDYFKREAIEWGWEFLTGVLELPAERLWITVYTDDDAAADIWANEIGVPSDRIVRLGDEHNFWGPAGDSGPCGPDSEIHFDMGADVGCGRAECDPGCDCDRFFEIWNLVFPQYLQHADGTRESLARPGIDTGMGFERLCSVIQGVPSLYETDVLRPIVKAVRREVESRGCGTAPESTDPSLRIMVDHARAATFAIAENILPSNEGQGYVVRRLIRRAVRRGQKLGIDEEFLYRVAGAVIETAGGEHPHLTQKREHIALLIKSEEERFRETLAWGTEALAEAVEKLKSRGETVVPGDLAFRLYDTYGFPVDLTREMAAEEGLSVDLQGFEGEMEAQRARGRASTGAAAAGTARAWSAAPGKRDERSAFVGYGLPLTDRLEAERDEDALSGPVEATVWRARDGADPALREVVLSSTPFYAESGGQVADTGRVEWRGGSAAVRNVYYEGGDPVHVLSSPDGRYPAPGDVVRASVDVGRRRRVEKNHTATHLLQAALRQALGDHVHQSGSWVGPDRLRFDFTHFAELSPEEIRAVEDRVNASIRANLSVSDCTMALDDALARGAMALFGEKYDPEVRAVEIPGDDGVPLSLELCGGTHVRSTGEIGSFAIVSESSVAAGVRRIEAVTGRAAAERARESAERVREAARLLRATPEELLDRLRDLADEAARLRKEVARERSRAAEESIGSVVAGAREVAGVRVVTATTDAADIQSLRAQADRLREEIGSGVGVLGAEIDGSGVVIAVVTEDLAGSGRIRAGDVVRRVAEAMGGRGGGRPHMAQGGGDAARIGPALETAYGAVAEILGAGGGSDVR